MSNKTQNQILNKKIIFIPILALLLLVLSTTTYAKVFVIQNESVNMFVVNGSSGNIFMTPSFGDVQK